MRAAVTHRDTAALFDWLMTLVALQGISDAAAFAFDAAQFPRKPSAEACSEHWPEAKTSDVKG